MAIYEVNVDDYQHLVLNIGTSLEDWQPAIQQAIADAARVRTSGSVQGNIHGKVKFSTRKYQIRKPILTPTHGIILEGTGATGIYPEYQYTYGWPDLIPCTIIEKTTTATWGPKTRTARGGSVTDNYDVNAIIMIDHNPNMTNYSTTIRGMFLRGNNVTYGIYAPRATHLTVEHVQTYKVNYGYYTHDTWMATFLDFKGRDCISAVKYKADSSNGGTGTSSTFIDCWANTAQVGFDFENLSYSTLINCGADHCKTGLARGYSFSYGRGITLSSCGAEDIMGDAFVFSNNTYATLDGCLLYGALGATSGQHAPITVLQNSRVIANTCVFNNYFGSPSTSNNVRSIVRGGSKLKLSFCLLPNNVGSSITESGSTLLIE